MALEKADHTFPKVAILMSTYNGEKYIREQIDSILIQIEVDIYLYIRDDCSDDSTVDILEGYQKKYPDKIFLKKGKNIGPGYSFMDLVYAVPDTFDFYAYSDQDDIWLKDKIIRAIERLCFVDEPRLYCSNQTIYIDGKTINNRFNVTPQLSLESTLCRNYFSGCTMVFNNSLAKRLKQLTYSIYPIQFRLHDTWTCLIAWIYGSVIYDENSYILYRIHENNTVGVRKRSFAKRVERFIKSDSGRKLRSKTARAILENCNVTRDEDRAILEEFANYQNSFRNRLRLINDESIRLISGERKLFFAVKVLLNMF